MNVAYLLNRYFDNCNRNVIIEVFDNKNIYSVYTDIVNTLSSNPDIELGVMQALSYCFYEVLDNVLTHSSKQCGTAILYYDEESNNIKILVADDGIGVCESLRENPEYKNISLAEALELCIQDNVSDGKGMGFGLYSASMLVSHAGVRLYIHSENKELVFDGLKSIVCDSDLWTGTIVCLELKTNIELDSNDILENRVDAESEYNEAFIENDDLDNLW